MIKIITDSSCDLDFDIIQKLDILSIPFTIDLDGKLYKDKIDISPEEFYSKISEKGVYPKTFQISPAIYENIFVEELDKGNEIICITASSGLTGTYNSANLAKNTIESDKVYIVDSTLTSLGQGALVVKAAEMSRCGASVQDILSELDYLIKHQGSLFALGSLEMLKRGGRIPTSLATLGNLLNIKPIITFKDGKLVAHSKVRGSKSAFKTIIKYLEDNVDETKPILIVHGNNIEYSNLLSDVVKEKYPNTDIYTACVGPSVASHAGPGIFGLFFIKKNLQ